ncbi:centromere protein H [Spea bombifrons]|uniref:centromere protein H n=1 Tax=Spea bombifrons TaxID=233779 RepID=UPI00234B6360|nr:centromere protein H [Spea bombifrons]
MDAAEALSGSLESLKLHSAELGKVALVGAYGQEKNEQPNVDLLQLLRLREQVKHQLFELQNMVQSNESSSDFYPEENLTEVAKELRKEIENVKLSYKNKTAVLQRMQYMHVVQKKLQENDSGSRLINNTIKHTVELSSSALKVHQETRELQEKIYEVRKKRLRLKEKGSKIMSEIQNIKISQRHDSEVADNAKTKKICKRLEEEVNTTRVIQSVFQNLILGSRVNWADDSKLREIVLKLEKNPTTL